MMASGLKLQLIVILTELLVIAIYAQQPEPEPESTPEPESQPEHVEKNHVTFSPYAEPEPEWDKAKPIWGIGWQIHVYGFGVSFALVATYSFLSVIRLWKRKHLLSQPYFISLNLLVSVMTCSRSLYLLIDAYNSNGRFPSIVAYILYAIVFPCLTSMFSLVFFALLAATRMTFISKSVQKIKVILFVIIVHFVLSITTDVLVGHHLDARIILFVCQMFYLAWGLFLFVGFMFLFKRLYKAALVRQKLMNKHISRKFGLSTKTNKSQKLTLSLAVKVTLVSSVFGLLTVCILVYGMVDVYGVFNYKQVQPWKWWGYHTAFRIVELAMSITITYIATQPFRHPSSGVDDDDNKCTCYACAPCWSWCYRERSYLLPDENWSDFNFNSEVNTESLKRNESQKGDFPLHHIRRYSQDPTSPSTMLNTPMLKADHGQLLFSNGDQHLYLDNVENPNFYHSNEAITDQATLKIGRVLQQEDETVEESKSLLTKQELLGSKEELNRRNGVLRASDSNISVTSSSQQSIDRISQLSPELDSNSAEDTNELLADV